MTPSGTTTACRALVAGFGRPGMRDLDFGRQLVECLHQLEWPDGVVVEELSCAVPIVLHRLQELRPGKVVLVGAVARDLDPPGALRRYRVPATAPDSSAVRQTLEESLTGLVDLDHTLAVARHWGGLPADTVVIEVEPAEASFGMGFSDALAACIDPILDLVREELAGVAGRDSGHPALDPADLGAELGSDIPPAGAAETEPSAAVTQLLRYAEDHAQARLHSHRAPALVDDVASAVPGVNVAGRLRPWGVFVENGGDWFDALPLGDGRLGVVVGNVEGRGVEAAAAMRDLRAAVRAYAVLDGASPAGLLRDLDRLAWSTGLGRLGRLLYLVVDPVTGTVLVSNAGGCPPLVLDSRASGGHYVYVARSAPLGMGSGDRPQATLRLAQGSTVLLFTDGLVESHAVRPGAGLDRLRRAAASGPAGLSDLCEHVLGACTRDLRRDDDICLVGVRLGGVEATQTRAGARARDATWATPRQADTAVRGSAANWSTKPHW